MKDAVIVGAGLAGLHCALTLQQAGLDVVLVEASDAAGGRVRTDEVDGFRLDRGFQVLLTAYPEARSALDYPALDLRTLKPGALVWKDGRFHRFADPFRDPLAAIRIAFDPMVTLGDKLRVARLRGRAMSGALPEIFAKREQTTLSYLEDFGFSRKIIGGFFEPFFGGVFLEKSLVTSSRYFEFLFRMFSAGAVAVPAAGMEAIPRQLAERLRPGTLILNTRVDRIARVGANFAVTAGEGGEILARAAVLATEEPEARRLRPSLDGDGGQDLSRPWNSTTAFYFAANQAPVEEPILLLNGEGSGHGPVNNAVVLSRVASSYAPAGAHLISASVVGEAPSAPDAIAALEAGVRRQLKVWFGSQVDRWRFLRAYPIEYALPLQRTAGWDNGNPRLTAKGAYQTGDFTETASIQGALTAGRRAAEALIDDRRAGA